VNGSSVSFYRQWGLGPDDVPVQGDYDGDKVLDLAVYGLRPRDVYTVDIDGHSRIAERAGREVTDAANVNLRGATAS